MKKRDVVAFIAGLIFAVGLAVSGMTQPHKVIGFLDLFGDWDPSLIFVMIGAILVHAVGFQMIKRRASPVLDSAFHLPGEKKIMRPLVTGAMLFGIGWGLGGFCPGPALVSLVTLNVRPLVFVVAMVVGMICFRYLDKEAGKRGPNF